MVFNRCFLSSGDIIGSDTNKFLVITVIVIGEEWIIFNKKLHHVAISESFIPLGMVAFALAAMTNICITVLLLQRHAPFNSNTGVTFFAKTMILFRVAALGMASVGLIGVLAQVMWAAEFLLQIQGFRETAGTVVMMNVR